MLYRQFPEHCSTDEFLLIEVRWYAISKDFDELKCIFAFQLNRKVGIIKQEVDFCFTLSNLLLE